MNRGEDVGHGPWVCVVEDWYRQIDPEGWNWKETRYHFATEEEALEKKRDVDDKAREDGKRGRVLTRVQKE